MCYGLQRKVDFEVEASFNEAMKLFGHRTDYSEFAMKHEFAIRLTRSPLDVLLIEDYVHLIIKPKSLFLKPSRSLVCGRHHFTVGHMIIKVGREATRLETNVIMDSLSPQRQNELFCSSSIDGH